MEVFVALLAGALVVGVLAERFRVPYTVALVAAGLGVTFNRQVEPFDFGAGLLFFFLPPLLFEAAWNLQVSTLRRVWRAIAWLAIPGVVLTLLIIAVLLTALGTLGWRSALILGAIVSATDPVAVIATFRRISVPLDLQTIVEGESLANDGIAVALFVALLAFAQGGELSISSIILGAVVSSAGGIIIGVLVAYAVALLLRGTRDSGMMTIGTVLGAYGSFIVADVAHVSGIFATISAGITLRSLIADRGESVDVVDTFWAVVAFLANSLVFLLMGLRMQGTRLLHEPLLIASALFAVIVSRVVVAYTLPPFREIPAGHGRAWRRVIAFAGMRGGLALALVLSLPATIDGRSQIIDAVFAIVIFTVIFLGLGIGPVVTSGVGRKQAYS